MAKVPIPQKATKFQGKNEYRIYGETAEIVLCDNEGNEKARVTIDSDDVHRCAKLRWCYSNKGYAYSYKYSPKCSKLNMPLHGFILRFRSNRHTQIDHINRDRSDNRKSNLRIVTHQQNMVNNGQKPSATGLRGVYPAQSAPDRWRSIIKHNGFLHQVGTFDSPEEAAIAWNKKALELRGEFAVLNEI